MTRILTIVHALSNASENWKGRRGRIDADLIRKVQQGGELWLVSGPEGMEKDTRAILEGMGVNKEDVFIF